MRNIRLLIPFVVAATGLLISGAAKADGLQILISPTTSISPGQSVSADLRGSFDVVELGCDEPLQCTQVESSKDYTRWSIYAPVSIKPGPYYVQGVASSLANPAEPVLSARTSLTVPVGTLPKAISFDPPTGVFGFMGDQKHFRVIATLQDDSTVDVSQAAELEIQIPATIKRSGTTYTAVAAGDATVTAVLAVGGRSISTTLVLAVPRSAVGDLNGDEKIDSDDLNMLLGFRNHPANGPNDARDLNRDGKIDALDARILTTLCTYPRCASTP